MSKFRVTVKHGYVDVEAVKMSFVGPVLVLENADRQAIAAYAQGTWKSCVKIE